MAAVGAAAQVAAERRSTAGLDRAHHPALHPVEMAGLRRAPRGTMAAEDVRHLQGAGHGGAPQAGGTTSSVSRSSGLAVRPMVSCETWV
jgi:hypothetical protein